MKQVWNLFQNQILGMQWLNELIGKGLKAAGIDTGGKIGTSAEIQCYSSEPCTGERR